MRGGYRRMALAALVHAWCLAVPALASEPLFAGRGQGGLGVDDGLVDTLERTSRAASTRVSRRELEQVLVVPQRPGRTNVRYYDFQWRRYDYLDDQGVGGVRFYFYDREEKVAKVAAALVREQYESLSKRFNYRPTSQVPYILYNSHREFQNTNAFFVSEGVLGVTSPLDLRMALPFWGEVRRFREVSLHEMVHQFTIQKVADRAASLGVESPVMLMPLWFIEGIAEWYSKDGLDFETDMFARDLLLNARPEKGYLLIDFWADAPRGFVYTYKLGQLRVAFLVEQYGERIVQAVLDQSPRLGTVPAEGGEKESFKTLVARLADETPEAISLRFQAWMKRRYLPSYLATRQEPPAIEPVTLPGEPDAFSVSTDGFTIVYRSVERDTGRSRLYLADRRDPKSAVQIAVDGTPGFESLHPVLRSVTAVSDDTLAFFARDGSADALYVQPFTREVVAGRTRFTLGARRRIDLSAMDLIEAGDPAFSPRADRLAFFGLDGVGRVDVWIASIESGELRRVTDDYYAERDLTWVDESPSVYGLEVAPGHQDGTLILATDRTAHGYFNLEALDPASGQQIRLTDEAADHRGAHALGKGRVVFSTAAEGKPDLHLLDVHKGTVKRLTDFVTGLTNPTPGPKGLMALGVFGGQYQMFDVPTSELLSLDERQAMPGVCEDAQVFPVEPIPSEAPLYDPLAVANWRLENGMAAIGTASVGQGALLFGDVLGDRSAIVQLAMYGSLSLTDAMVFYVDRSARAVRGLGVFHTFTQRRDLSAPGFGNDVLYLQREFGVTGLWAHPFDTFSRVEARAVVQGVDRNFQFPITALGFPSFAVSTTALRTWEAERGGLDLETLLSVRLGYDSTRYRFPTGAFGGLSLLLELGGGYLPFRAELHRYATLDTQYHLRVIGPTSLHLRVAGGWAGGSVFGRQFFLSSYDNLRMFTVNDQRLLGSAFAVANVDFEIPLDQVVALALVSNIEGVIGLDFGGVASRPEDLWNARALALVLGANLGLGPFEIRVHFARPFDINPQQRLGPGWVPNVSLRYAYF